MRALLFEVRLFGGRYHGVGDWPPSPFRLFQALVSGAYGDRWVAEPREGKDAAFHWLERLDPPSVLAPPCVEGRAVRMFVPNNDLDAKGGDPRRVAEVRAEKQTKPLIFSAEIPFVYAWAFEEAESAHARLLCELSERLHTLGRGIDAAFARGRLADWDVSVEQLRNAGRLSIPAGVAEGKPGLRCPAPGSLDSLMDRFDKRTRQLDTAPAGLPASTLFRQPPRARCTIIRYGRPPERFVFDIRRGDGSNAFRALPQTGTVAVTTAVRDLTIGRLTNALPSRGTEIEHVIAGRGASPPTPTRRVRIIPLPSIGFAQTNGSIRRILVEVPWECPLSPQDVAWALSGQSLSPFSVVDRASGELLLDAVLVPSDDDAILRDFGIGTSARTWRSVTPVALPPQPCGRPRTGNVRAAFEGQLTLAVVEALRHAGLPCRGVHVRVQREPFRSKGATAEAFASGRFSPGVLFHVEVGFPKAIAGPVVIGDGRWLGLGIMAPVGDSVPAVHVFRISGSTWPLSESPSITRTLRRAVLSRAGVFMDFGRRLPPFFSGHEATGSPVRGDYHGHLFYLADDSDGDGMVDRLFVVAPHLADRTANAAKADLRHLDRALEGLHLVRAGRLGVLQLASDSPEDDRLFGCCRVWESLTAYRPTRHPHGRADIGDALIGDIRLECLRRGLPRPAVSILQVTKGVRGSLRGRARLSFATAVKGPLALGRGSHFGEGVFIPAR